VKLNVNGVVHDVRIAGRRIEVDGLAFDVQAERQGSTVTVHIGPDRFILELERHERGRWEVKTGGQTYSVQAEREVEHEPPASPAASVARSAAQAVAGVVRAPVPGRVLSIKVKAGDSVVEGDLLLMLEAMKMENEIRAAVRGVVREVLVSEGARVGEGDPLVIIE
jgi:biotin carboxyl carrier protein